ncbi:protein of unknown function [Paraburkholderia kururiensis]
MKIPPATAGRLNLYCALKRNHFPKMGVFCEINRAGRHGLATPSHRPSRMHFHGTAWPGGRPGCRPVADRLQTGCRRD